MIDAIFNIVAKALVYLAKKFGITYNEVNIIVYYLLIPISWTIMGDVLLNSAYLTVSLISIWSGIFIVVGHSFRRWCDEAFNRSVIFLEWFRKIGWNYTLASVIICVVVPLLIYASLIIMLILR